MDCPQDKVIKTLSLFREATQSNPDPQYAILQIQESDYNDLIKIYQS